MSILSRRGLTVFLATFLLSVTVPAFGAQIGVYYFPGWHSKSDYWNDIKGAPGSRSPGRAWPDREPLLGHYPEEEQWVAERHIEWASSYGISFFAYDWYWNGRQVQMNHALDAYRTAKNKHKLKFTLLWANHFGVPSNLEQFTRMVDYWIEHYFPDSQYLKIDGKPVVFVFSPLLLRQDAAKFGATTGELFKIARARAAAKGYPGIYFVGSSAANSEWVKEYLPANGYDAISAYKYPSRGFSGEYTAKEPAATSYAELMDGYQDQWRWILKNSPLPYFVPMTAGWDRRPWGSDTPHDRCYSTPDSFRQLLREAKRMMDRYPAKTKGIGIIYAWNEFGEGGYVEPTKKWGFQYLQAIKDIFGK